MDKETSFRFGPGALDMLSQGLRDENNKDYSIYLKGDLCQMSAQAKFLRSYGVSVEFNNVYPCVRPCDREQTFRLIWKYKCDGWWHYKEDYEGLGICGKEEFRKALKKSCESHKQITE